MAITSASPLFTIVYATSSVNISSDSDEYALTRLDNGSIALVAETFSSTQRQQVLTVLNATNTARTGLVNFAIDTATTSNEFPSVTAGTGGNFVATFDRYGNGNNESDSMFQFFSPTGSAYGGAKSGSTSASGVEFSASAVLLGNGNYLATWSDSLATPLTNDIDTDIMGRIFSANGTALGGEFRINAVSAGAQLGSASVGLADGRAFSFWSYGTFPPAPDNQPNFTPQGLQGRFIDVNGVPTGAQVAIDTMTAPGLKYEDADAVTLATGWTAVVWQEQWDIDLGPPPATVTESVAFQIMSAAGNKVGGQVVVETGSNVNGVKAIELSNGGFAVMWQVLGQNGPEAHVRTYSMSGAEIGSETILNPIANATTDGLDEIYDLELTANGKVLGVGYDDGATGGRLGTQIFDFGDERLVGSNGANTLFGLGGVNDVILALGGDDVIKGLSGHDSIDGGLGNDTMTGGAGVDSFLFTTALSGSLNRDRILDFSAPSDTIKLENAIFTAFAAVAPNTAIAAGQFWASSTGLAHDADDRIIYNTTTGALVYDVNGTGASGAVSFAVLSAGLTLTNADFVII